MPPASKPPIVSALEDAFLDTPVTIAGHTLRPLSASSFRVLQRTQNRILSATTQPNPESGASQFDANDPELFGAMLAFIYIHAAPLDEVLRASRAGAEEFEIAVETFAAGIPLSALLGSNEEIAAEVNAVADAVFEAEPPEMDAPHVPHDPNS